MVKILVVYDSRTGNTEKMALAVAEGAKEVADVKVTVKMVGKVRLNDLLDADGIILGSPTYYGGMSGKLKEFIDTSFKIHGKLAGKAGGAFTSSGDTACGAETTLLSMTHALLIHGMVVQGRYDNKHYGATAVESPKNAEIKSCEALGKRVATLAKKLCS
ncbi:MAG: NAD(P)H-dependent oxidoreductase [Thermoplasmata archaeon]|nr:NAD(P)H-dependent oxidoreductase [Thermoplasmata archaeon]MCJ7562660.1 NAD(P)H-dependent oxidoreductase [Thermoplasmata archaeon]TFG68322.1 MAG: flavodoxin family protein [Methanomassiliicoccus sp.]